MSPPKRRKPRYVLDEEAAQRPPFDAAVVPVNVDQLSETSQRSRSPGDVYISERYQCIGCGKECVYTAHEQKHDCEVKKLPIHTRRKLCETCHTEWGDLLAEIRTYPERLRAGIAREEAKRMRTVMERYRRLNGGRFDSALYRRIGKFIAKDTDSA